MLKDWVTSHANMGAGHQNIEQKLSPVAEERPEVLFFGFGEHGEPRQRIAFMSADRGGQPPDAAASVAQLGQFFLGEFDESVRRVGADSVNALRFGAAQPIEAIRLFDLIQSRFEYQNERASVFQL